MCPWARITTHSSPLLMKDQLVLLTWTLREILVTNSQGLIVRFKCTKDSQARKGGRQRPHLTQSWKVQLNLAHHRGQKIGLKIKKDISPKMKK